MGVNGIYGLSGSGMDIESMVKVGMMSRQNEYDKMAQKFTQNEWLKADYLELNNQITTFNASTLSQYKMSNTMNAKSAETNSTQVKASVNSAAAVMDHKVQVTQVASAAYLVGTNNLTRYNTSTGVAYKSTSTDEGSSSIKLSDVLFKTLATNSAGNVYGQVAGTDLDMEDGTRDKASDAKSADGVKVRPAYKFGWADGVEAAYWTKSDGTVFTPTNNELRLAYMDGTKSEGWRYQKEIVRDDSGSDTGERKYYWQKYDSSSRSWVKVDDPSSDEYKDSFKAFIDSRADTAGYNWEPPKTVAATSTEGTLSKSATAFSFTLSDGVTKNEAGTALKEVTISYTYAQLMGDDGKTFNDLVADINKSGLNIKASYDSVHDLFSFYNSKTGADNTIDIKIGTDTNYTGSRAALATRNFFNNLGLYQSVGGELYKSNEIIDANKTESTEATTILFNLDKNGTGGTNSFAGTNAEFKIDGVTYDNVASNNITVGGVTYTALEKMNSAATVTITQDTDAIIDKVKSFITDYNKLLASLYEKYEEKPNSDYKPLTQSQKDSMKEEQITKWEEKAKKGLLYHDQTIGKIIQNMRNGIIQSVEGVDGQYNSVFSLGISTTGLKGQLVLDEDKLKKALSEDPDSVYNVFAKLDANDMDNQAKSGVAQRLGDILVTANKSIKDRAGSSADITEDSDLNSLLRNLQTKMSNFKKLMNSFEDALYKKYDAMEATLAKLGTQLNFIMGGNG